MQIQLQFKNAQIGNFIIKSVKLKSTQKKYKQSLKKHKKTYI